MEGYKEGVKVWDMKPEPHEQGRTYTVEKVGKTLVTCVFVDYKKQEIRKNISKFNLCLAVE